MNIVLIIVGLVALFFIAALFVQKKYTVKSDVLINKPVSEVFEYVKHIKNQDYYSKWVMTDPNKKTEFRGTDGTVGFVYAWNGNKQSGEGEQEIIKIIENKEIDTEIRFVRPFASVAQAFMILDAVEPNKTRVTWGMHGESKYPLNLLFAMFGMTKMLVKDLAISLNTLKTILEK